jgi:hypothetical protein
MMLRRIGAVLLGLVIAVVMVQIAELGVHVMYPPPPGTNMHDMNAIKAYVASMPMAPLLLVLAGWLFGTLLGTWVAAKVGRSAVPAYVVGVLLLCGGIANSFIIPQPVWFSIASLAIYIGGTLIAVRLASPQPAATPAPPPA